LDEANVVEYRAAGFRRPEVTDRQPVGTDLVAPPLAIEVGLDQSRVTDVRQRLAVHDAVGSRTLDRVNPGVQLGARRFVERVIVPGIEAAMRTDERARADLGPHVVQAALGKLNSDLVVGGQAVLDEMSDAVTAGVALD